MTDDTISEKHCPTCICGRRAPVQSTHYGENRHAPGTIAWSEHLQAWAGYNAQYPGQSAERIAERGGFSYGELQMFLGHDPITWEPRRD